MNKAKRREQARLRKQRQRERLQQNALVVVNDQDPAMIGESVPPTTTEAEMAKTGAQRVREYRERRREEQNRILQCVNQPVDLIRDVTPPVTLHVTPVTVREPILPRIGRSLLCTVLVGSALALAGTGIIVNGWYARSLGSTEFAGWLFLAVGVATDAAALALPSWATVIWRRSRMRALGAWGLWSLTFAFALSASLGFASVNIADTRVARTTGTNPVIEDDKEALRTARDREARECKSGNGVNCRKRIDEAYKQQDKLDSDRSKVVGDPQSDGASKLVRWLSVDRVVPSADDFAMFRLALLTLLPQVGGLLLMVARR
jgi:hypothetical protein